MRYTAPTDPPGRPEPAARPAPFPSFAMKKSRSHFPSVPALAYEGPDTTNPLAFRHYNPDELVDGRPLSTHLRFSIAYWHAPRPPFSPRRARPAPRRGLVPAIRTP